MRLALFDLDNTLLAGDSDYEWGQFLVDRGVLDREEYESQNRAYYEQYVAGTLDIHEFLGFALRPLAAHEPGDLERWRAGSCAGTARRATCARSSPRPTASSLGRLRTNSPWSTSSPPSRRRGMG